MTEPVYQSIMAGSLQPVEVHKQYMVKGGGDDITYVTRKYEIDGPVVRVSESSVTLYDRYGQTYEVGKPSHTKEIFV